MSKRLKTKKKPRQVEDGGSERGKKSTFLKK